MFRNFLTGRYGFDRFSRTLIIASVAVSVATLFVGRTAAYFILRGVSFALLLYAAFRIFSRNFAARQGELARYMAIENRVRAWWSNLRRGGQNARNQWNERKAYKYLSCPQCLQKLRVPRGKGNIRVTCTKCGHKFQAKS